MARTSFIKAHDPQATLANICKDLGLEFSLHASSESNRYSPDQASIERQLVFELPELSMQGQVMTRFLEATGKGLWANGCRTNGSGVTGERLENSVSGFSFDYDSGNTRGIFRAFSIPDTNNRWRLWVINIEW